MCVHAVGCRHGDMNLEITANDVCMHHFFGNFCEQFEALLD